jgi:hypothetical protein
MYIKYSRDPVLVVEVISQAVCNLFKNVGIVLVRIVKLTGIDETDICIRDLV